MNFHDIIASSGFIQALGWTLLHSNWQGFLILVLTSVLMWLFRKHSAIIRYSILCVSLFLIFFSSVITFISLYPSDSKKPLEEKAIAIPAFDTRNIAPYTGHDKADDSLFLSSLAKADRFVENNGHFLVLSWFLGFMLFILRYLTGLFYIHRLKRNGIMPVGEIWSNRIRQLSSRAGLKRSFKVLESLHVEMPVTIGYLKPVILFPLGMMGSLPPEQVEAILMHEMAHIIRRDYLVNALQSVIEAFYFYHPAVWFISKKIRTERENICDDIAVRHSNDPLTYIKALTTMEELTSKSPVLANAFTGNKKQLLNRVRRVLRPVGNRIRPAEGLVTVVVLLTLAILFGAGASLNTSRAGSSHASANPAINPDAVNSITSYTDRMASGMFFSSPSSFQEPEKFRKTAIIGKIDPIYTIGMLQPDTTKKTAAEEAEKDRQADEAEKEAALERMREALHQKQEAMNAYHEALKEYQELLKEKQMEEWEKSLQWAFSADSLDSAGVFVWPAMPEMPELFYFYDEEFEDLPIPEEPLFGCPDPRRLEYSYQFRYPDKRGIFKGDKPRIIIKDLDEDLLDDLDIDIYRHPDKDAYHPGKRYEKEIIIKPPDVMIPRAPRDPQIMIMKGNSPEKIMRQELIEDGLVRMGKDYIIELDSGSMYINGVKQSREIFKKYKKIYEGLIGKTLEGDFSYKLVF